MLKVFETKGKTLITLEKIQRVEKSNVPKLFNLIEYHIKKDTEIFLNLNNAFFIDTAGFKALLSLRDEAKKIGSKLRLIQLSGALLELFSLMELCDQFEWASAELLSDPAFMG